MGSPAFTPVIRDMVNSAPRIASAIIVCFDGLAVTRAVRLDTVPIISFQLLC